MKTVQGTPISPGIVSGTVCLYLSEVENTLPHYAVDAARVPDELKRLNSALEYARKEMRRFIVEAEKRKDKEAVDIFTTHLMVLSDKQLAGAIVNLIELRGINAEHAVADVFGEHIRRYEKEQGHFRELAHDFIDARNNVLAGFEVSAGKFKCEIGDERPVIVAARRLTPSMVLRMKRENVLAFVAQEGGITSHATILARTFNVPIVFGIDVEKELDCGMQAIVNGAQGVLVVAPDQVTIELYDKKMRAIESHRNVCLANQEKQATTADGSRVNLKLNISTPDEVSRVHDFPHDGVGLLRTEFLFMRRDTEPDEEEQYRIYARILEELKDVSVTVRLLDISADKIPLFLSSVKGNDPGMEFRGAMAVDLFPELYLKQIRALLRANVHGNLRLLFPMVSDVNDFDTFRRIVASAAGQVNGQSRNRNTVAVSLGTMAETPSAIVMLPELLMEADFVNIGSNDLVSYTLAASRGNALAEARYHILHPALVKLLEMAAREGKKAGKEVCLCGEIASFEEFYPLLLSTGLTSFSVSVSRFENIKCEMLHRAAGKGHVLLDEFYRAASKQDVDRFIAQHV